jgi:hypothetical protein
VVPASAFPLTAVVTDPSTLNTLTEPKLLGTTSEKVAPETGLGPPLRKTKVNVTVPPTATSGVTLVLVRLRSATGATVSASSAVHTPATQLGALLVLVKPEGGAMLAAFRTVVCADTVDTESANSVINKQVRK